MFVYSIAAIKKSLGPKVARAITKWRWGLETALLNDNVNWLTYTFQHLTIVPLASKRPFYHRLWVNWKIIIGRKLRTCLQPLRGTTTDLDFVSYYASSIVNAQ